MKLKQIEMISLEDLVRRHHPYRHLHAIWDFTAVEKRLVNLDKASQVGEYGLLGVFKCLLLQYLEDLSDQELARYIQENIAAKWFCGFGLAEPTPDFFELRRARDHIGVSTLSGLLSGLQGQLQSRDYANEDMKKIDASRLIAKVQIWRERDDMIMESKQGNEASFRRRRVGQYQVEGQDDGDASAYKQPVQIEKVSACRQKDQLELLGIM